MHHLLLARGSWLTFLSRKNILTFTVYKLICFGLCALYGRSPSYFGKKIFFLCNCLNYPYHWNSPGAVCTWSNTEISDFLYLRFRKMCDEVCP